MQWHDWNDAVFERAQERRTPVLLFLRADWCRWCREMERSAFADPEVLSVLTEHFVCVRVDKDRHPEVDERYRGSGWPTLAWLDSTGELISRSGFLEPGELAQRARMIADQHAGVVDASEPAVEESPAAPAGSSAPRARRTRPRELGVALVDDTLGTLLETADPTYGGWGKRQKFPHPEALHFATVRWSQTGRPEVLDLVLRTLRHMQEGEIYDRVEGGFYRYATAADWSRPHYEKLLDSNAQRLMAYVEAFQALGDHSFRRTAEGILSWMQGTLLDEASGCFFRGQDADPEYARLSTPERRATRSRPPVDEQLYTNWNAMAARALLKASVVFEDDSLAERARHVLDFLVENLWDEQRGVYHYWDGTYNLPGRLSDHAYLLRSLVEAMHYSGANHYLRPALAIARFCQQELLGPDGACHDKSAQVDPLRTEGHLILENAVLAEALLRLSHMARDPGLAELGRSILSAFLADYPRYGHFTAGYGRAVSLLVEEPVHVIIVGQRDADSTRALRRAALQPYVASRIVQTIDPATDEELLALCGIKAPEPGSARAYVQQGRESYAETSRPERLPALMARAERSN